jgi:NAD(P)-dependent dehydrogenase (short-subunit alcohol dehydrogenase family)
LVGTISENNAAIGNLASLREEIPMSSDSRGPSEPGWTPTRRLAGKVAVVIGAGQTAGQGLGNGRATTIRFAREGARVLAVDRRLESAHETAELIRKEGFECEAFAAEVTRESDLEAAMQAARRRWGSLDVLYNNVGVSLEGGDADLQEITEEAFDNIYRINLRGTAFACKQAVRIMREQGSGSIVNMASAAAVQNSPTVAYRTTKAAVITLTQQLAIQNAPYGIRANCLMPGLIDTPMAVEKRAKKAGLTRDQVLAQRDSKVPLRGKQGTAWDVANAALFLASDEANFITGIGILIDGGRVLDAGRF